ncbi:amidohydrolase [Alteribacter salitolerans]|uniref:amidohydrolase n=1 Tax=Alteribacter salitolerans TaxID=2912333 RepID=UPI003013CD09
MGKKIIKDGWFLTMDEGQPVKYGYMVINEGKIEGIYEEEVKEEAGEVIDAKGKLIIPGFVNTHGHTGSTLLRGAGDDLPLNTWLKEVMWPMEQRFTKETTKAATSLAIGEMLKSGTTTFLDMYHLHMDQTAELILESGMNGVLCRGMIGLCSKEEQAEKLKESVELYKTWHNSGDGKIKVMLAPHAPYTCPPDFMEMIIEKAHEHGIALHTHLSETRKEVEEHIGTYGKHPAEHLSELGFFEGHALIAHGVHLSDAELSLLARKGTYISHNPKSNLKLGSGVADLKKMKEKNIRVCLGTDSSASNNTLDMFEEMRFASLIHKGVNEDPTAVSARDILFMAAQNGGKALQYEKKGRLKKGYDADFSIVEPGGMHTLPDPEERIVSHLVYAHKGSDVTDVFANGKQLVKNKELLTMDEEKIRFNAREALAKLRR